MNTKEVLAQIKVILGMEKPEEVTEVVEVVFADSKLKDGTSCSYDKMEVGGLLKIKTDPETEVTAPAGSYELEDGTKIVCDEAGVITEVIPVEEKPEEEKPEEVVAEVTTGNPEEKIAELESRLAKLEEAISMLLGEFSKVTSDFDSQKQKLEELAKAPAAEPVHFTKEISAVAETIAEKRVKALLNK